MKQLPQNADMTNSAKMAMISEGKQVPNAMFIGDRVRKINAETYDVVPNDSVGIIVGSFLPEAPLSWDNGQIDRIMYLVEFDTVESYIGPVTVWGHKLKQEQDETPQETLHRLVKHGFAIHNRGHGRNDLLFQLSPRKVRQLYDTMCHIAGAKFPVRILPIL